MTGVGSQRQAHYGEIQSTARARRVSLDSISKRGSIADTAGLALAPPTRGGSAASDQLHCCTSLSSRSMIPIVLPVMHIALRAASAIDTVWVEKPIAQGTFDKITSIANGVMTLTILGIAVTLIPAAWNF